MNESLPRKAGRPKGTGGPHKTDAEKQTRRTVTMNEVLWEFCTAQPGGAAAFLRRLAEQAMQEANKP